MQSLLTSVYQAKPWVVGLAISLLASLAALALALVINGLPSGSQPLHLARNALKIPAVRRLTILSIINAALLIAGILVGSRPAAPLAAPPPLPLPPGQTSGQPAPVPWKQFASEANTAWQNGIELFMDGPGVEYGGSRYEAPWQEVKLDPTPGARPLYIKLHNQRATERPAGSSRSKSPLVIGPRVTLLASLDGRAEESALQHRKAGENKWSGSMYAASVNRTVCTLSAYWRDSLPEDHGAQSKMLPSGEDGRPTELRVGGEGGRLYLLSRLAWPTTVTEPKKSAGGATVLNFGDAGKWRLVGVGRLFDPLIEPAWYADLAKAQRSGLAAAGGAAGTAASTRPAHPAAPDAGAQAGGIAAPAPGQTLLTVALATGGILAAAVTGFWDIICKPAAKPAKVTARRGRGSSTE